MSVETEIELIKRDIEDMKEIHVRLDTAIEKIADVSSSLHTMHQLFMRKNLSDKKKHELDEQEKQLRDNIKNYIDRVTSNAKETKRDYD